MKFKKQSQIIELLQNHIERCHIILDKQKNFGENSLKLIKEQQQQIDVKNAVILKAKDTLDMVNGYIKKSQGIMDETLMLYVPYMKREEMQNVANTLIEIDKVLSN
jgi:hypothetical protein